jgi:predicted RNase H-like HicB family nuclease
MNKYLVVFEKSPSGYGAYVPDLPGCVATSKSKEETEVLIYEAIKFHLEGIEEEGLEIPKPSTEAETFVFS